MSTSVENWHQLLSGYCACLALMFNDPYVARAIHSSWCDDDDDEQLLTFPNCRVCVCVFVCTAKHHSEQAHMHLAPESGVHITKARP